MNLDRESMKDSEAETLAMMVSKPYVIKHARIYIVTFWTHTTPSPPPNIQIISIPCSFWGNLAKLCIHVSKSKPPSPQTHLEGSCPHLVEICDAPL